MSRLYASIRGSRGEATRQGHSHITGHIRGWTVGVQVNGRTVGSEDVFEVFATHGSLGGGRDRHIATVRVVDGEVVVEDSSFKKRQEKLKARYKAAGLDLKEVSVR